MISLAELQPSAYAPPKIALPQADDILALYPSPAQQQQSFFNDEPELARSLANDSAFASAVRAGDVHGAALASFKYFNQVGALLPRGGPDDSAFALPYGGSLWEDSSAGAQPWQMRQPWNRNLRPGDWVVIQNVKKASDSELLGHQAQVQAVGEGGMIELHIPRLNTTARLHHRYLSPAHGAFTDPSHHLTTLSGHTHTHSRDRRGSGHLANALMQGEASTDTDDMDRHRSYKRHDMGGSGVYSRGSQPLLPARVSNLMGRGLSKARDVGRTIRKECLYLEEGVPWDLVDPMWKGRRAQWQRALKSIDSNKSGEGVVPLVAQCLFELHDALKTDKSGVGVTAVLARGGDWETRLLELAQGGNNHQCLQQLWDEMYESVKAWLHSLGRPLPPPPVAPLHIAPPPPPHTSGHHASHAMVPLPPINPGLPSTPHGGGQMSGSRSFPPHVFSQALKAVTALQDGVAATDLYLPVGQLVVERVMALGREASANLRALLKAADEVSLNAALDTLAGACDVAGLIGVTSSEMDRLSDVDVLVLMLASPAVRSELRVTHSLDSEVDTDIDAGSDVTDMDIGNGL